MHLGDKSAKLTPKEFEKAVQDVLRLAGAQVKAFETKQREKVEAADGSYEIDVTIRFEAFGVWFFVLVECKKQNRPVEREMVQVLYDRIRAVGAHKGIMFSTGGFQSGAIKYAQQHGIALIEVAPGHVIYGARSKSGMEIIAARDAPPLSYWHCSISDGKDSFSLLWDTADAVEALGLDSTAPQPASG